MNTRIKVMREQIKSNILLIKNSIYTTVGHLSANAYLTKEPLTFADKTQAEHRELKVGDKWGELFDCAWFHITGKVPQAAEGKKVVLIIDLNGEGCIFDANGCPVRGITNVASFYDYKLGMPGKRVVGFSDVSSGQEEVDLWIDAGCNDLFGRFQGEGKIMQLDIAVCNDNARDLYYDMSVLDDMLDCINQESARYCSILYSMQDAIRYLSDFNDEEFISARKALKCELNKTGGEPSLKFNAIGHAHIDLAWLWPIRETKRKAARTMSTVLDLMNRYPDYIFGASQPQLFEWIKVEHPLLFDKIKKRIEEGRFEVQGGMWVEPDTNIPSGESLVRQFLYGKRYFRENFGIDVKYLWLPDVFGYSAALPQIIKKSGCDYFATIKLSWNEINKFPYHTFTWEGIDGSRVLTHMPPEGVYNSASLPHSYIDAEKSYQEKGICSKALCLYGIGDGGGGPGPEHLERLKRLSNLEGIPPIKQTHALKFFEEISVNKDRYPNYKGELYLEKHQGTLTSQAKNKKMNRIMENKLHTAELLLTQAALKNGAEYPYDILEKIWKEVLLYQVHDILPGSSIKRVYDESLSRYAVLEEQVDELTQAALNSLCDSDEKSVYNQLPWERKQIIKTDNGYEELTVPAFGFSQLSKAVSVEHQMRASKSFMENELVRVEFNENGFITSLFDKQFQRECVESGKAANELVLFADHGDAWDFPADYRSFKKEVLKLKQQNFYADSCYAVLSNVYEYRDSSIYQEVVLQGGSKLVNIKTNVDWHEKNKMLRAEFPLNIYSDEVSCDIQFGHIKRSTKNNNSIEQAQTEIAAHKWIDLSETDYGVSILNNCKYGFYAKGSLLSINLLRLQDYPCVNQDEGKHDFCYAIYPHKGNLYECDVEKAAYDYNFPMLCLDGYGEAPFIAQPENDNIIIETVKLSENSKDVVIRLYENKGKGVNCSLTVNSCLKKCILTNLIEDEIKELEVTNNIINLTFKPFEVHTIKLS